MTYGDTGSTVSYTYDANSNLGQLTDGISGRVNRYSYDFLDRLMRYEESGDGYSNIIQWGYDDENNLSSQTQTLNGTTYTSTYAYDKDNRLTKATEGTISANYTYDSFSRMTGLTAKNGSTSVVNTAVTYVDPSSSATSTQVKTWNNGKAAYTYTYDNKGNITSITGGGQEFEYRYDKYGRLISAEDYPGGYVWTYTYDDGGNITQRGLTDYYNNKNPNSILATYTYGDANWPDLLTAFNGKSITYDAIGNPLSDGTWTYAWQHGRQLASMSKSGSSIAYGYNADGKRISKTVNGTTYNYAYLGDTLTDLSWDSNRMHFTYDSLGPASVTYNGVKYFYLKNAQGDVTGLVNASGTQVVSYTYDPWGAPMSTDGTMASTLGAANPLRYRGYVYDTETGFYYLSSRYYNPVWGRFINADGIFNRESVDGGNLFAYCLNNPIANSDRTGYFAIAVGTTIASALFTFVASAYVTYEAVNKIGQIADDVKRAIEKSKSVPYAERRNQSVYVMRDKMTDEIKYVGRTNNPQRRNQEHRRDIRKNGLEDLEVVFTGLTKKEAIVVEQSLISAYALENLHNARREIAAGNVYKFTEYVGNVIQLFSGVTESELLCLMEG